MTDADIALRLAADCYSAARFIPSEAVDAIRQIGVSEVTVDFPLGADRMTGKISAAETDCESARGRPKENPAGMADGGGPAPML